MGNKISSCGARLKHYLFAPSVRVFGVLMFVWIVGQTSQAGNLTTQILYTDSHAAILKADVASGSARVVVCGQKLVQPLGIAAVRSGEIFITDTGSSSVIGINPKNGRQRVVATGGVLGVPFGIAAEQDDSLLIANAQALLRLNPRTGVISVVSSGSHLNAPIAVAVVAGGGVYVVDALGAVILVDPANGQQTLVTKGNLLNRPQGIAVTGADIYVTDVANPDGQFGEGRIIHINGQTGEQRVLSEKQNLVGPVGITLAADGLLIVGDPYTINEKSVDRYDGAIISVDRATGSQKLISRGQGEFVNPRGVLLVPQHGTGG